MYESKDTHYICSQSSTATLECWEILRCLLLCIPTTSSVHSKSGIQYMGRVMSSLPPFCLPVFRGNKKKKKHLVAPGGKSMKIYPIITKIDASVYHFCKSYIRCLQVLVYLFILHNWSYYLCGSLNAEWACFKATSSVVPLVFDCQYKAHCY